MAESQGDLLLVDALVAHVEVLERADAAQASLGLEIDLRADEGQEGGASEGLVDPEDDPLPVGDGAFDGGRHALDVGDEEPVEAAARLAVHLDDDDRGRLGARALEGGEEGGLADVAPELALDLEVDDAGGVLAGFAVTGASPVALLAAGGAGGAGGGLGGRRGRGLDGAALDLEEFGLGVGGGGGDSRDDDPHLDRGVGFLEDLALDDPTVAEDNPVDLPGLGGGGARSGLLCRGDGGQGDRRAGDEERSAGCRGHRPEEGTDRPGGAGVWAHGDLLD